jgi:8-oxo-dGTP pyrophosphatase MutT (NUDIX family)
VSVHPDLNRVGELAAERPHELVFFVGAGLSAEVGYPTWSAMLERVIEHGRVIGRLNDAEADLARETVAAADYLECGEILHRLLGARLPQFLADTFSASRLPAELGAYEFLVRIPCAGFITTNYDSALESAYVKQFRAPIHPVLPGDAHGLGRLARERPFLLKIHGDASASRFVLSSSDYAVLQADAALARTLYAINHRHTVVFLGYGLSDRDILEPLRLLAGDATGVGKRHVALLPAGLERGDRARLEDELGVNVVEYDTASGHAPVFRSVVDWYAASSGRRTVSIGRDAADVAALLRAYPEALLPDLRLAVEDGLAHLQSLDVHWGPRPADTARAANVAEGLLAIAATRLAFRHGMKPAAEVAALLGYQHAEAGNFISVTMDTSNLQTHALAMCALEAWEELDPRVPAALERGADWLLSIMPAGRPGWGRVLDDQTVRVGPTIWCLAALLRLDRLPRIVWINLRARLLRQGSIGHGLGDRGVSCANAGWVLWFLSLLMSAAGLDREDEALARLAVSQISDPRSPMQSEIEMFPLRGASPDVDWKPWFHPTAAAVTIGLLPWLDEFPEAWRALGRSISALVQQWETGGRCGYFQDAAGGRQSPSEGFLVSTFYGVWALGQTAQQFGGVIIRKSGLVYVRDGRLLVLRKKGTDLLILPGGSVEPGESAVAGLHREIFEELGAEVTDLRPWGTIRDRAAFEKGVLVEIEAYTGRLQGAPVARAEIGEVIWFDIRGGDPRVLSPIIANQLLPRLRRASD